MENVKEYYFYSEPVRYNRGLYISELNRSLVKFGESEGNIITCCGLYYPEKNVLHVGFTECNIKDQFNKKIGRKYAKYNTLNSPSTVVSLNCRKHQIRSTFIDYCKLLIAQQRRIQFKNIL